MLSAGLRADTCDRYLARMHAILEGIVRDAGNAHRIRTVLRDLPIDAMRYFGFEWHFDGGGLDVALNLSALGLRRLCDGDMWPEFAQLARVAALWPRCDASNVWLEWDTRVRSSAGSRAPSLYITVDDFQSLDEGERAGLWAMAGGRSLTLQRCIDAAPSEASRLHLGFMRARPKSALRVGILMMNATEAASLAANAANGVTGKPLEALLDSFSDMCDGFSVQFDCDEASVRLVGSELFFRGEPRGRQPEREPRWYRLLNKLVELELASEKQVARLLAWPGRCVLNDGELLTGLQHVKLVTTDGRAVRAKAYFGAAALKFAQ